MKRLDSDTLIRKKIARRYINEINNDSIELPNYQYFSNSVWHIFPIMSEDRDLLMTYLKNNGIGTIIHYPIPPHLSRAYSSLEFGKGYFSITEKISKEILSIPINPYLTEDQVSFIIETINNFLK